ncbi:MspA family porin [Tsukamurella sp. 8F]|uniref:MspA family porin n=1 Tax=unclassified Tsukamurella TaxID=2633480 RepID=UPI0023B9A9AF|nr:MULTISPECIES: MspA family porin [unclassified Tsukamurella]MDF0531159.1 MspA family porin [Tsukamurella sp. 8J]MDF0585894.1 MspA family porin [Tsukamurella sp. 8F]
MKKALTRGAAVAAVAGTALAAMAGGAANADTYIPLPGGTVSQKVPGGSVTVRLTGEHARLSPGMVALPTTRNAWVSGTVTVTLNGAAAKGGNIGAGYVVGCQINLDSAGVKAGVDGASGASVDAGADGLTPAIAPKATVTSGATVTLSAGSIAKQPLIRDKPKWPEAGAEFSPDLTGGGGWQSPSTGFKFTGKTGTLSYSDETIGVDGCAGYAQARFYASVGSLFGDHETKTLLWGKPFTLG